MANFFKDIISEICRMYLIIVDNEYAFCLLYCYKSF